MALVDGDMVIPAGSFNGEAAVANLAVGTLCPDGVAVGTWVAAPASVIYNNGMLTDPTAVNPDNLRKCTPYSGGTSFLGKFVHLDGACAAFRGLVIQEMDTELDDTNGNGVQTPVLVVQTDTFTYVAEPANVSEVD